MNNPFTAEEVNLLCIYDTVSRVTLIQELFEVVDDFEDADMFEIAQSALNKLTKMRDADFARLTFHPVYHDEEVDA